MHKLPHLSMQLLLLQVPFPRQRERPLLPLSSESQGICVRLSTWAETLGHQAVRTGSSSPGLAGKFALGSQKPSCPWCPWLGHVPQLLSQLGQEHSPGFLSKHLKAPKRFHRPAVPVCLEEWFGQPAALENHPARTAPCSSYSWDCCELQAAPQAPHNQGAPHPQLPSPSVLQFQTTYLLWTILLDRKWSVCIVTCELIFTSPRISPGFSLKNCSQHNHFLVHTG